MKIFDWVHQRILANKEYCRVPHHKKDPYVGDGGSEEHGEKKVETEKAALLMDLHHVTSIQHILEEILTIGTLGHLDYQCQQELLGVAALGHQGGPGVHPVLSFSKQEPEEAGTEGGKEAAAVESSVPALHANHVLAAESFKKQALEMVEIKINGNVENSVAGEEGDLLEPLLKEIRANRRERITLADLFLVSDDNPVDKVHPTSPQQAASASTRIAPGKAVETKVTVVSPPCDAKLGAPSLTKKFSPWKKGGEGSPPANKKLHGMIRRMLKKKIHPEMARDVHASVPGMQACSRTGESASLL